MLLPKNTIVLYSPFGLHRNTAIYADANDFRPQRWESLRVGWEYLPFNGGPRICLGQQYALTEASYVIIRLLQTFKGLDNRDPELEFKEALTLTMASGTGTKVALTPA